MKIELNKWVMASLTVILIMGASSVSFAIIKGSAHDFTDSTNVFQINDLGQICLPCHTPHNSNQTVTDAPLWNHQVTAATYTVYKGIGGDTGTGTFDATPGQPSGVSKLCLSCHDGTVALDSYGGATDGKSFLTNDANLTTDLSNDHPISFTYDTDLANTDGELFDPDSTPAPGLDGTIAKRMLFGGQMECASCHDVHNARNNEFLLVINNTGSQLCLTCHEK